MIIAIGVIFRTSPPPKALYVHAPWVQLPKALPPASLPPVDCAHIACVALTFDDGPNPITTPQILDILEQEHVPATFFVVGMRAAAMPAILQRMYRDGDEVGNHSWDHTDFTTLTSAQIQSEVSRTQAAVTAAGLPAPTLFRPPYGALDSSVLSEVPLSIALWNVDPRDWALTDPGQIIANVESEAKPGGILEMHDIHEPTVQALDAIVQNLKTRFSLVTYSQLLNLAPGSRGEFFGR